MQYQEIKNKTISWASARISSELNDEKKKENIISILLDCIEVLETYRFSNKE